MSYLEIKISADTSFYEIYMAELAEIGFDTFQEENGDLLGYGEEDKINRSLLEEIMTRYSTKAKATYSLAMVEKENWNEEWEKNFDPIQIDDRCIVRATFHKIEKKYPHEIIITPKMSFGTGHHATTYLMLSFLLDTTLIGKSLADLGCGTGILAILAKKLGTAETEACDIDEWCIENSTENFSLNGITDIDVKLGEAMNCFPSSRFDIVLANINKNVLLSEISHYSKMVKPSGNLFLSGFYEEDIPDLVKAAEEHNFEFLEQKVKDNWAALKLVKNG